MSVKQVNVRLEESLIKEVKRICLERDMTFQQAVSQALTKWVNENK